MRVTHPDYLTDADEVIRRAEAACGSSVEKYHLLNNNCEHFATGCKGLMDGYGWSYQSRREGKVCYKAPQVPQQASDDQGDDDCNEPQQTTDDWVDDDMDVTRTSKDKLI